MLSSRYTLHVFIREASTTTRIQSPQFFTTLQESYIYDHDFAIIITIIMLLVGTKGIR